MRTKLLLVCAWCVVLVIVLALGVAGEWLRMQLWQWWGWI